MSLEQKLLEEVARFNQINKYTKNLLNEQELPPPPAEGDMGGEELPPPPAEGEMGGEELPPVEGGNAPAEAPESDVEEIDITDLVNMTKSIKSDLDDTKGENSNVINKMDDIFGKLGDLEQKLANMDAVMSKIDELGSKVEMMKEKTPEEKLELRSLDSYPFNQNPQQFFAQKQDEMRATGKNEYVLTKDDVQNYSDTIRNSFNPENDEDEFSF